MHARSERPPVTDGEVGGDRHGRSVERPSADATAAFVETALEGELAVSVVGVCEVVAGAADGEAGAGRPRGTRHALLKPDGSVVVHGRDGTTPDSVLTDSNGLDVSVADGILEISASDAPAPRLRFRRIDRLASFPLDASGPGGRAAEPADASEKATADRHGAIRERLVAEPDRLEPGFRPLATERETSAGPVDLFGRDAEGRAVVVEIKGERAGPAAVGQLDRYVSALRRELHADAEVRGVLVAPSATERTRALLDERGFDFRRLSAE